MIGLIIFGVIIGLVVLFSIIIVAIIYVKKGPKYDGSHIPQDRPTSIFTPGDELAGKKGEALAYYYIKEQLKPDEYLLKSLLISTSKNNKTEIDLLLISRKGIYAIEVKNWSGILKGGIEDTRWTESFDDPNRKDKSVKNPTKQNKNHVEILNRLVLKDYDIYNVVIVIGLDARSEVPSDFVYSLNEFISTFKEKEDELSPREVKKAYEIAKKYEASEAELKEHQTKMKTKYKDN